MNNPQNKPLLTEPAPLVHKPKKKKQEDSEKQDDLLTEVMPLDTTTLLTE